MTRFTDTHQLVLLSAARQRLDRRVLPLRDRLKSRATKKVIGALIAKGLVAEVGARPGDPVWREADDSRTLALVATPASDAALGLEPESGAETADEAQTEPDAAPAPAGAPVGRKTRAGTHPISAGRHARAPRGRDHRRGRRRHWPGCARVSETSRRDGH